MKQTNLSHAGRPLPTERNGNCKVDGSSHQLLCTNTNNESLHSIRIVVVTFAMMCCGLVEVTDVRPTVLTRMLVEAVDLVDFTLE